jgi:hypothetical protein
MSRSQRTHLLGLALLLATLPSLSWPESLPASVRACAAETDSLRRLTCYDREVARYMEPKPAPQVVPKREPFAAPATDSTASTAPTAPATPVASADTQPQSGSQNPAHIAARVVAIDRAPNEMVLHLDNGQIWQELQGTSGDLSLQVGDTVKIDKNLGSWWLTGPHVSGMKVREKT